MANSRKNRSDSGVTKKKIPHGNQGKAMSEETKRKISVSHKNSIPWNKGRTGVYSKATRKKMSEARKDLPAPMTGWHHSAESRKKMSESAKGRSSPMKGKKHSESARKKMSNAVKKGMTKAVRKKMSESAKGRSSPMKGKKHSESARKKMSKGRKGKPSTFKGKKHSAESRKKISASLKGKKRSEAVRKKMSNFMKGKPSIMKGKHHSEESKRKNSESNKRPKALQAHRESRSKLKIPSKDSKIELQTQKILSDVGIKFEKHVSIKYDDRRHSADILIRPNKIIEVNGHYHFDPRIFSSETNVLHRKKIKKPTEIWVEEKERLDKIRDLGYEILIVWDLDLKKNLDQTTKKILKFVNS